MKTLTKLFLFLLLCSILNFGFYTSDGCCGNIIEFIRRAAEEGDASAQFRLALLYYNGDGVPKNLDEAVKWCQKAAEQGHAHAQFVLAVANYNVDNLTEAVKWYRIAAVQGHAEAQYNLGVLNYNGRGVQRNFAEAAKWYRLAAEQGNTNAQFNLALLYYNGEGVPRNFPEAVKWYRKAAEQGHADAQFCLGIAYNKGKGVSKNLSEAVKWCRMAAEQGHANAQLYLASSYYEGEGVKKNFAEAVKWFRKAAAQDVSDAQFGLGVAYYNGEGVPKNEIEALAWFNIAATTGYPNATAMRANLEKQLGRQATLSSQQRSKEILKEIESAKQKKARTDDQNQIKPQLAYGNAEPKGSGTGVFVTNDGLVLTAAHVIAESSALKVFTKQGVKVARVVKVDASNDLALLKCDGNYQSVPVKPSSGIKVGRSVFTVGFPNIEFQGFSPKMTKGEINSLSGLQDDPRHWQISVPVQPGNSGGPLFDETGNVVGVVLAKLDAIKVAKATGDFPQNVNYAIKSIYTFPLLEAYVPNLNFESGLFTTPENFESVVEKVQDSVVLILVY